MTARLFVPFLLSTIDCGESGAVFAPDAPRISTLDRRIDDAVARIQAVAAASSPSVTPVAERGRQDEKVVEIDEHQRLLSIDE